MGTEQALFAKISLGRGNINNSFILKNFASVLTVKAICKITPIFLSTC
jgi:hypothetical protein